MPQFSTTNIPEPIEIEIKEGEVQSKALYLQAAGSDGSDGTVEGVHLRWALRGNIGNVHLPKGNLAIQEGDEFFNPGGFNRRDDFVYIYRTDYKNQPLVLNFAEGRQALPDEQVGVRRRWIYLVNADHVGDEVPRQIFVDFLDTEQYDRLAADAVLLGDPKKFVQVYTGVMQIEVKDLLLFGMEFKIRTLNSGCNIFRGNRPYPDAKLFVETISKNEAEGERLENISCRKVFTCPGSTTSCLEKLYAENVTRLRLQYEEGYVETVHLETYTDFIASDKKVSGQNWANSAFLRSRKKYSRAWKQKKMARKALIKDGRNTTMEPG